MSVAKDDVLRVAPAKVLARLALSSEEAFLVSRLDGPTRVADLLRVAALPEKRALELLQRLVEKGALEGAGGGASGKRETTPPPKSSGPYGDHVFSPGELNEDVELGVDERKRILFLFHRKDELSYFALLGVTPEATAAELRSAYLARSKEFHPDRYFRKRLGGYQAKISALFQALKKAYDTLADEERRRAYERENASRFTPDEQAAVIGREIARLEDEKRQKSRRERLLRARGFARLTRARELAKEGDDLLAKGDLGAAAASYQLALDLDPRFEEARGKLTETTRVSLARRVDTALEAATRFEEEGMADRAVDLLAGAAETDPKNVRVHARLAELYVQPQTRDAKKALLHARLAVDLGDTSTSARRVHGEALLLSGMKKNARRELEAAAEAGDSRAKHLLDLC